MTPKVTLHRKDRPQSLKELAKHFIFYLDVEPDPEAALLRLLQKIETRTRNRTLNRALTTKLDILLNMDYSRTMKIINEIVDCDRKPNIRIVNANELINSDLRAETYVKQSNK